MKQTKAYEQLKKLDNRLGFRVGAKKEREKLWPLTTSKEKAMLIDAAIDKRRRNE